MSTGLHRAAIDDAPTTLQNAAAATANGDTLSVKGWDGVLVQVTGSFTATITFEATLDGTTWVSVEAYNVASGATATTATAAADYLVAVAGFEYFRTRVTWSSGTSVTTKVRAFPGSVAAALSAAGVTSGTNTAGTMTNTADAAVDATAGGVTALAANTSRKAAFIQNVGAANIRVGTGTLTATTGLQLIPGATLILQAPFCPTAAIKAIREGSVSSTVAVAEIA